MYQMSGMYARVLKNFSRHFVVACRLCFYFSLPQFVHRIKRTLHIN